MQPPPAYVHAFNESIRRFFRNALRVTLRDPAMALFAVRTMWWQKRAAKLRLAWDERGTRVPPIVILSVTNRCNLRCAGCYFRSLPRPPETEMTVDRLRSLVAEAHELGVSVILLAGGEPLVRPEVLDITRDYPSIIFPVFTNGLLIDSEMVRSFKKQKNVVPVISLEGPQLDTDRRRGSGVHENALRAMALMKEQRIFFGTSLTLTSRNFTGATDEAFIRTLIGAGNRVILFIDYVPTQEGTESLVLTDDQKASKSHLVASYRSELPCLFISFPDDEEALGGCMAAGRGFVNVSPGGRLEPCPASPVSDSSLVDLSLREALASDLLATIRENESRLTEVQGGCALWENREWVESLLQQGRECWTSATLERGGQ